MMRTYEFIKIMFDRDINKRQKINGKMALFTDKETVT